MLCCWAGRSCTGHLWLARCMPFNPAPSGCPHPKQECEGAGGGGDPPIGIDKSTGACVACRVEVRWEKARSCHQWRDVRYTPALPLPLCFCSTATTAPTMQASASGASLGGRSTLQRTHASWARGRQHHCLHHCQHRRQNGRQNGRQVRRSTWPVMPRMGLPITSSPCLVNHAFHSHIS